MLKKRNLMKTKTKIVNISTIVQHRDLNYLFVVRTQKMIIERRDFKIRNFLLIC